MGGVEIHKKKGNDFSREVLKFMKKVVKRLSVLDMVVEKCAFSDVFLKLIFKKHVNHNEQTDLRNIRKPKERDELNFFGKMGMRIYTMG